MRHDLWRAILAARWDLDKLVTAAVGDYPDDGPPRAATARPAPTSPRAQAGPRLVRAAGGSTAGAQAAPRAMTAQDTAPVWLDPAAAPVVTPAAPAAAPVASVEQDTLNRLHQDAYARVELLRQALVAEPGGEQAMLALVLYFDEHIMAQLPRFLATSWPLLQTRFYGRKTGGSDFFRGIDRLLEEMQPAFVFEVYYFCLSSGFQGAYADDLTVLENYKRNLRARIAAPEPQRQPLAPAPAASSSPIKSPVLYYLAALVLIVVVAVALTVWSNR